MDIRVCCFDCGAVWTWDRAGDAPVCPKCGGSDVVDLETNEVLISVD